MKCIDKIIRSLNLIHMKDNSLFDYSSVVTILQKVNRRVDDEIKNSFLEIPILDYHTIEIGDKVIGKSDGKHWTIIGFKPGSHPLVCVNSHNTIRDLKVDWVINIDNIATNDNHIIEVGDILFYNIKAEYLELDSSRTPRKFKDNCDFAEAPNPVKVMEFKFSNNSLKVKCKVINTDQQLLVDPKSLIYKLELDRDFFEDIKNLSIFEYASLFNVVELSNFSYLRFMIDSLITYTQLIDEGRIILC